MALSERRKLNRKVEDIPTLTNVSSRLNLVPAEISALAIYHLSPKLKFGCLLHPQPATICRLHTNFCRQPIGWAYSQ